MVVNLKIITFSILNPLQMVFINFFQKKTKSSMSTYAVIYLICCLSWVNPQMGHHHLYGFLLTEPSMAQQFPLMERYSRHETSSKVTVISYRKLERWRLWMPLLCKFCMHVVVYDHVHNIPKIRKNRITNNINGSIRIRLFQLQYLPSMVYRFQTWTLL